MYKIDALSARCTLFPPPSRPSSSSSLRLVQWNINALSYLASPGEAVLSVLRELDADVIMLQEFSEAPPARGGGDPERDATPAQRALLHAVRAAGYVHTVLSQVAWPTLLASRLPLAGSPPSSVALSANRAAARMEVRCASGACCTLYATHLDFQSAPARRAEAGALLGDARAAGAQATIIAADFNQPRAADSTREEWDWIMQWREAHGSPASDGVDELLQRTGFTCCLDEEGIRTNWQPGVPPPPTHWTGTAIDRAYSRGSVRCVAVWLHSSAASDHHPVVTDWLVWDTAGAAGGERKEGAISI